jgi:hypothetical protein
MKTIHMTVLMTGLSLLAFEVEGQPSFLTNGLAAYYPFKGNANDASGNGNNGIVNGAVLTTDRFGNPNSAYGFNGVNQWISFAAPPLTNVVNWTFSAWVKPANYTKERIAVQIGFDNEATGNGYGFGFASSSTWTGIFSGVGGGFISSGRAITDTNEWYQVVMLRDSTTTSFYINGTQTPSNYTIAPKTPTDFTIGSQTGVRFFSGLIDDVRVYNRALSSSEVAQLYSIESGLLNIQKAVYLNTCNLSVGSNYVLQLSSDLVNWTNYGGVFTATNTYWQSTNYFDVQNWNQLFFRLLPQ